LRCRDQPLAALIRTSGRDLAALADDTFDLVLAIDSFPYLVATSSDLAAAHLCEAARVLRPAGLLAILNYSYSDDPKADAADVLRLASNNDFAVLRNGTRDFKLWDAATFLLQRA
jgi:SAM-dependent methyltransferase